MKKYFLTVFTFIVSLASFGVSADGDRRLAEIDTLELSVGKVILSVDSYLRYDHSDTNPFGIAQAFVTFKEEYQKNIKTLSVDHRVNYFWAGLWHLGLQGGYLTEFEELVLRDCANEFIKKLEHYVQIDEKLQRNKTRLMLSKIVLNDLKRLNSSQ